MELPTTEQVHSKSNETSVNENTMISNNQTGSSKSKRRHISQGSFQQSIGSQSTRSLEADIQKRLTRSQAKKKHISSTRVRNKKAKNAIIPSPVVDERTYTSNKKSVKITYSDYSDALSVLYDSNSVDYSSKSRSANTHVDCPEIDLESPSSQDYFSDISEENDSDFHLNAMVAHGRRANNFV